MKKTKELIERTIRDLPHNLENKMVRTYLAKALFEINKIESKKQNNKITPNQKWQLDITTGNLQNMSLPNFNNAISTIENLIFKEQEKLNKNNQEETNNLIND